MKLSVFRQDPRRASTILMVLALTACTFLILGGILSWAGTNTNLSGRNNEYFKTVAAAEAATEKVLTAIAKDYQTAGESLVFNNLAAYRAKVPVVTDDPLFGTYEFSNGLGQQNQTHVEFLPPSEYRVLSAQYKGLRGYASKFRLISNSRDTTSRFNITGAVRQDIEVATIPLFQFAIFYNLDLEINPGPVMTVSGPVHSNKDMFLQPLATLTFQDDVTAAGNINNNKKPGDPTSRTPGTIVFNDEHDSGVSTLNLPIGLDNSPANVRKVIEPPAVGEDPNSALGKQRYHNKADLIVTVTGNGNANVTVSSGISNNKGTTVPSQQWDLAQNSAGGFINQVAFYNKRENKTIRALQIDVGKMAAWSAKSTNMLKPTWSAGDVTIVYVDDKRAVTSSEEPAVRLVNGATLPTKGLTVATPVPLYVQGHYNAAGTAVGSHNTATTKPASLIGDSINILSTAWKDANATLGLGSRVAASTTINAAVLSGIVETTSGQYSGGVENYPRFLEDWNNKTLTYNGSMVVMFPSKYATGLWQGTGSTIGIYNPPIRDWAFDLNFRDPAKLPPGTPAVRALIRGTWHMIKPNSTNVASAF